MRHKLLTLLLLASCQLFAQPAHDLVIVGGNPGGIMAAIAAAREGKTSVILERTSHIGGLPANGLGATDIATRGATTGLFLEYVNRIKAYYAKTYGTDSQQVKDCNDGYRFEPSVASKIFQEMLAEHQGLITVLTMRQFDAEPQYVTMTGGKVESIRVLNRLTGQREEYKGKIFIDATYEGDLAAAAGIPFRVGREGKDEFGEHGAGRVYKYWGGTEGEGTTFQGDNAIQSYNYRLCLTNDPAKRILFQKPEHYDRDEFASMVDDVLSGRNTFHFMQDVTEQMMEENRKRILAGGTTQIPGDRWGIAKVTNMTALPNNKTDANNQHAALISTDLPEENWPWPTSSWEWRDKFSQRLKEYTEGLLYFAQNDEALPAHFREATRQWGMASDEYTDNGNFPRQVYVREGRRFMGMYFLTAKDALPTAEGQRPPVHATSITASHYALDSHAVRKREPGKIHLEGFISYHTEVYTVPYEVIVPREVDNLLFPVPVSASHIGFSTLRMEPCWMAMGEAAGIASAIAIDDDATVRDISTDKLQDLLLKQGATLIYFTDITPEHPDFALAQRMALHGYLPDWEARLDEPVDEATLKQWKALSRLRLKQVVTGQTLRKDVLRLIHQQLRK